VEKVAPGLWSVPVPIPNNPLGHTFVYVFETDRGPVLVDAGWDDDTTWKMLTEGLVVTGHDVADVYGVLVTHMHADHHGLSGRVKEASGAWVAMHPADARIVAHEQDDEEWLLQMAAALLDAGAAESDLAGMPNADSVDRPNRGIDPDRPLDDGAQVDVPGWSVWAIWTPGHSPGHTCFYVEGPEVLLSGDHVLPEITPHIGLYTPEEGDRNPLGEFLDSLRKVSRYDVREVLPAHQHRFTGLKARTKAIVAHHHDKLGSVFRTLADGPASLWRISADMPWNRAWEDLHPMMKRVAVGEAMAHVRFLEVHGLLEALPGQRPITYQLTAAGTALLPAGD
jgi:glyoxylase-like metal-dependent hydrolase (beta-lactamase superfamily II)